MLQNPQTLINISNENLTDNAIIRSKIPDAIYIPFRNRYDNLNMLLKSLSWYSGQIILLMSNEGDTTKVDIKNNQEVTLVHYSQFGITDTIKNLKTFKTFSDYQKTDDWDLPIKRNFALLHSVQKGFQNVLLIDDDIDGITSSILSKGAQALESNDIAGCLIEGYPDTSVIGHIEQKYGDPYHSFLSGSFLFIRPDRAFGFFPLIYNEDWLFMVPTINQKKIVAVDVIPQKCYDPFDNIGRIRLQEFGEIIIEGLFELIHRSKFNERFNSNFWSEYIEYRRSNVSELLNEVEAKFIPFIKESLAISKKITPEICVRFINEWEEDLITFDKIKNNGA